MKKFNPVFGEMKESHTNGRKIVAFYRRASEMTAFHSERAARCDASESGIVRLCKKIGLGYQDTKIALAQYVASNDEARVSAGRGAWGFGGRDLYQGFHVMCNCPRY